MNYDIYIIANNIKNKPILSDIIVMGLHVVF